MQEKNSSHEFKWLLKMLGKAFENTMAWDETNQLEELFSNLCDIANISRKNLQYNKRMKYQKGWFPELKETDNNLIPKDIDFSNIYHQADKICEDLGKTNPITKDNYLKSLSLD